MIHEGAAKVLGFWIEAGPERWFDKNAEFDASFHDQFRELHFAAAAGIFRLAENGAGNSALLLLLDQFPRNCFRGTAHMFAADYLALHYARQALAQGWTAKSKSNCGSSSIYRLCTLRLWKIRNYAALCVSHWAAHPFNTPSFTGTSLPASAAFRIATLFC